MFNLKKHSQSLVSIPTELDKATTEGEQQAKADASNANNPNPQSQNLTTQQALSTMDGDKVDALKDIQAFDFYESILADPEIQRMQQLGFDPLQYVKTKDPDRMSRIERLIGSTTRDSLLQRAKELGVDSNVNQMAYTSDIVKMHNDVLRRLKAIERQHQIQQNVRNQEHQKGQQTFYNRAASKMAQMMGEMPIDPMMGAESGMAAPSADPTSAGGSIFPVKDAGDLSAKLMQGLMNQDKTATEEILANVQGEIQEEEINSYIERLWELDYNKDRDQAVASAIFGKMYEMLPARLKESQTPPTMENQIMSDVKAKGIIKFNLSDQVLNNKENMVKTAAEQFGQQYMLYGPTEKRHCPKLKGVVSEYICRHHCLDGIVIDDNKTVCGEALWRANVMDKFSREYVNEDGKTEGGYLNKRFEINRNIPEETNMRLKPGETRKPRPPEWGNLESRMQAMRAKEGEKRDYRPDTNTGDPFKWCSDVDQNNVDVPQQERNRRETAMGHELGNDKNKSQENKPAIEKTASGFNLKMFKKSQTEPRGPLGEDNPQSDNLGPSEDDFYDEGMNPNDDFNDEPTEPAEGDIVCNDSGGPFAERTAVGDKLVARTPAELVMWMEKQQFWPDVWVISDHGNCHLVTQSVMNEGARSALSDRFDQKDMAKPMPGDALNSDVSEAGPAYLTEDEMDDTPEMEAAKAMIIELLTRGRMSLVEIESMVRAKHPTLPLEKIDQILISELADKHHPTSPTERSIMDHSIIDRSPGKPTGRWSHTFGEAKTAQGANIPLPDDGVPIKPKDEPVRESKPMTGFDFEIYTQILNRLRRNQPSVKVTAEMQAKYHEIAPEKIEELTKKAVASINARNTNGGDRVATGFNLKTYKTAAVDSKKKS